MPTCDAPETRSALRFVALEPEHLFAIEPQDSQRLQYGLDPKDMSWAEACAICDQDNCHAVLRGDDVLACLGINETFPGMQGVAWAFLSRRIGRDIVPVTKFARDAVIGTSELVRIEAIVRCHDIEQDIAENGAWVLDPQVLLDLCMANPTPQVTWAIRTGLRPVAVLRKFGAASETHMLLERII